MQFYKNNGGWYALLFEIERFRVVNEASYLSQKDLANLMGLDCKIENSKVVFSD